MPLSRIYLGASPLYEQTIWRAVGVDLGRLHTLAQRIAWGILMGERLKINLDQAVDQILAQFDNQFAAHVAVMLARLYQGRQDAARTHLLRAQSLVTPDHPWASLVPGSAWWAGVPTQQEVEEVEPGRVYRVTTEDCCGTNPFVNVGAATFVRMRSGKLIYINPVKLAEPVAARIRQLGEVTHIIAPAKYHSDYVPLAAQQFPKARTFGVPAHRRYRKVAHIRFDGYLDDAAPLFPGELDQITMQGVDLGDVWFIDRPSATLLVTDSLMLMRRVPGDEAFYSPYGIFYAWAWGIIDRVGVPSYQPSMWQDLRAYQASMKRALAHDFAYVGSSHGLWHVIATDARAELSRSLAWLLALSRFEWLGLLAGFVRRHPGIFSRLVREQLAEL